MNTGAISGKEFDERLLTINPPGHTFVRKIQRPAPEPTLADVIALLEQQARTCAQIAKTLEQIAETVKGL